MATSVTTRIISEVQEDLEQKVKERVEAEITSGGKFEDIRQVIVGPTDISYLKYPAIWINEPDETTWRIENRGGHTGQIFMRLNIHPIVHQGDHSNDPAATRKEVKRLMSEIGELMIFSKDRNFDGLVLDVFQDNFASSVFTLEQNKSIYFGVVPFTFTFMKRTT